MSIRGRGSRGRTYFADDTYPLPVRGGTNNLFATYQDNLTSDAQASNITTTLLQVNAIPIASTNDVLEITFTACCENPGNGPSATFTLNVDGVPQAGGCQASMIILNTEVPKQNVSITRRITGLSPGAHNITISWVGLGAVIFVVSEPDRQHATLLIKQLRS